jgi:hypothetical protein
MLLRTIPSVRSVVQPIQAAVSEFAGEIEFADAEMLDTSSVVEGGAGAYRVTAITLDSLLERTGARPPDFLKIDVEGHEPQALRGASRVIRQFRPLMEFEALTDQARDHTVKLLSELSGDAFRYYYRIRHDGRITPYDAPSGPEMTNNYLAVEQSKASRLPESAMAR